MIAVQPRHLPVVVLAGLIASQAQAAPFKQPPVATAGAPAVEEVLRIPWGSGPGMAGRVFGDEADAAAASAFVVDASGRIWLLDQENFRVQVFQDGLPLKTFPLSSAMFQDIELDGNGGFFLMERYHSKALWHFDERGKVTGEVPMLGAGIETAGDVMGIFRTREGVWLKDGEGLQVLVADPEGAPVDERVMRQGRTSADGKSLLTLDLVTPSTMQITSRPVPGRLARSRQLSVRFPMPVFRTDGLFSDEAGRLFLVVAILREDPLEPDEVLEEHEVVVALGPDGKELYRVAFPPMDRPEEIFRPARLGEDGAVYYMRAEDDALVIRRFVP